MRMASSSGTWPFIGRRWVCPGPTPGSRECRGPGFLEGCCEKDHPHLSADPETGRKHNEHNKKTNETRETQGPWAGLGTSCHRGTAVSRTGLQTSDAASSGDGGTSSALGPQCCALTTRAVTTRAGTRDQGTSETPVYPGSGYIRDKPRAYPVTL
jgi:hypothetical protein